MAHASTSTLGPFTGLNDVYEDRLRYLEARMDSLRLQAENVELARLDRELAAQLDQLETVSEESEVWLA